MKEIEAIIRKTKFEDVKEALLEAEIEWFSYYDVRSYPLRMPSASVQEEHRQRTDEESD